MKNTTILPQKAKAEFKEFHQWHIDLKASLAQKNLTGEDEVKYLNEILLTNKKYYYDKIDKLGRLSADFTPEQKRAFFQYIKAAGLHDDLKGSPFFDYGVFKPRGYAGDAETMAFMYRNKFEGISTFAKLLHKISTASDAGIAIRNRRVLMHNAFKEIQKGDVLSIAAGPAQEIYDYLETQSDISFLALDHDIETIRNSNRKLEGLQYGIINAFHLIKGKYKYLLPKEKHIEQCNPKKDLKGINKLFLPFKYKAKELKPASYDLVYSIGLYDYIKTFDDKEKGTTALTKRLFDLLKPNGRLLIGNISPKLSIGTTWAMECLCDWYLIHRTKEEVLAFANAIPKEQIKSIEVITEETEVNWFLDIRKKA